MLAGRRAFDRKEIASSVGGFVYCNRESPLYRGFRVGGQAAQLQSCVREVAYDADGHLLPDRFARERFRGEVIRTGQADGHAHAFRRGVVEVRRRTPRDLRAHVEAIADRASYGGTISIGAIEAVVHTWLPE